MDFCTLFWRYLQDFDILSMGTFQERTDLCQTILIASKCQEPRRTTADATSARAACTALIRTWTWQSLAMACFSKIIQCLGNPFFLSNFPNESSQTRQLSNGMRSIQWRELYNWDQLGHIHAELHKSLELVPGRVKKEEDTGSGWNGTTSFSILEQSKIKKSPQCCVLQKTFFSQG